MSGSTFSSRLQAAIARSQLSERQLCASADISPQALANYVGGRLPKLEQAMALARALGVSVGWFLGEVSDPSETAPPKGGANGCIPLARPQRVWAALGNPSHKSLATRLGITPERAREILAEDALSPQELATLLDEVASIAMAVTDSRAHSQALPEAERKRKRTAA